MLNELKIYKSSRTKLILLIYGSMITTILLVLSGNLALNILGICLTFFTVYVSFISKKIITLSDTDIVQTHFEKVKTLKWNEISNITDYKLWIKVSGQSEGAVITINSLFENYSEIRNFISGKRPDLVL